MDERKNKVLLTVIGVLTFIAALVGATFAYFSATSTTKEPVKVTTSNLNLSVNADGEALHVTNIKPTTWNDTALTSDDNPDIVKIPFTVEGTSNVAGTYLVNMKTSIALNTTEGLTGGEVSDIKYRIYKRTDTTVGAQVGDEGSFAAATDVNIISNVTFDGTTNGGAIADEYVMFVYIANNTNEQQDQLQAVDFTISLGGSASQSA
jgi:predicted ribosomally synthesized peptide with SipW-like signal peptide